MKHRNIWFSLVAISLCAASGCSEIKTSLLIGNNRVSARANEAEVGPIKEGPSGILVTGDVLSRDGCFASHFAFLPPEKGQLVGSLVLEITPTGTQKCIQDYRDYSSTTGNDTLYGSKTKPLPIRIKIGPTGHIEIIDRGEALGKVSAAYSVLPEMPDALLLRNGPLIPKSESDKIDQGKFARIYAIMNDAFQTLRLANLAGTPPRVNFDRFDEQLAEVMKGLGGIRSIVDELGKQIKAANEKAEEALRTANEAKAELRNYINKEIGTLREELRKGLKGIKTPPEGTKGRRRAAPTNKGKQEGEPPALKRKGPQGGGQQHAPKFQ